MPGSTRARSRRETKGLDQAERLRRARVAAEAARETARGALARASARRDASWRESAESNRRRALVVMCSPLSLGAVLVILGVLATPLYVVGAALLVLWGALVASSLRGLSRPGALGLEAPTIEEAVAAGLLGAVAADRLVVLTSSLCGTLGLPAPVLRVMRGPGTNMLSVGRDQASATVFVTPSLVETLDPIELEAVLAHELSHVKRLDVLTGSFAASRLAGFLDAVSAGRASRYLLGTDREIEADLAAVSVTRYPPGLYDALEKLKPPAVALQVPPSGRKARSAEEPRARLGPLFLLPPTGGELEERLDVLREL